MPVPYSAWKALMFETTTAASSGSRAASPNTNRSKGSPSSNLTPLKLIGEFPVFISSMYSRASAPRRG